MHQFFIPIDNIDGSTVRISGEDLHHMKDVIRLRNGEEFHVLDGKGKRYRCSLSAYEEGQALAEILSTEDVKEELSSEITLYQGFPKGDKMELIIQKCVELGVHRIVPVIMERSVARPDEKARVKKVKRYRSIAESAAKQAGRGIIPEIGEVCSFREALKSAAGSDHLLLPYEAAFGMEHTREILSGIGRGESISVFIGPEGGFALSEVEEAKKLGAQVITLGKRILRTETAPIAVMSILMYLLEEDN